MSDKIQTTAELEEAAAMPRAHAVHCDPGQTGIETAPSPRAVAKTPVAAKSAAEWAYQRLILYIQHFERGWTINMRLQWDLWAVPVG